MAEIAEMVPAHRSLPDAFGVLASTEDGVVWALSQIKAFVQDVDLVVDPLLERISRSISGDYLDQAANLLGETEQMTHIAAAVLSGAVLEQGLRTLCEKQDPPIPTEKSVAGGRTKPLSMEEMINALTERPDGTGVIPRTQAKQLKFWAGIRNDAAHGRHVDVQVDDVRAMVPGVAAFTEQYL